MDQSERTQHHYTDLREWLQIASRLNLLKQIDGAHWDLEIGAITELEKRRGREKSSVLMFDNVPGYPAGFRVAANCANCLPMVAVSLGMSPALTGLEFVRRWKDRMREYKPVPPVTVPSGPVTENVLKAKDVDLLRFPTPRWNDLDGGRYIGTDCIVITGDPEEKWVNLGTYRVMVHDKNTLGLYISPGKDGRIQMEKAHKRGEPFPVAMAFGHDPLLTYLGSIQLPWGTSEYDYAGWVKGRPIEIMKGPVTGLPIPAHAEIVVEGFVHPGELKEEGPFGEFTGYYASDKQPAPLVRVESLMYRNNPIMTGTPMGRPPAVVFCDLISSATLWNAMEAAGIRDITGVYMIHAAPIRMFTVVAIKQRYPGHARQAGAAVITCRGGSYMGRYCVIVDDDIDPSNLDEVIWALSTRSDPAVDIDFMHRCWSGPLDPIIRPDEKGFNSRAIIDACRPYEWKDQFPKVVEPGAEVRERVTRKWGDIIYNDQKGGRS